MSDDEVEQFEVTDFDLKNEFNINRSRRPTKDQQIYGIWADDSDEEVEKTKKKQRGKKQKDYSVPIGFVAGGIQQPLKKKQEEPKNVETDPLVVGSSSEEEAPTEPPEEQMAGMRRRGVTGVQATTIAGGVGTWEKHTKGIGAKLLLQMGFQPGKGLGKSLQGMSAPVTANLRKGRGAIGAYGPEVKTIKKGKEPVEVGAKPKEEEEKTYQWKKSHKQRYYYRDAVDVIQEGRPVSSTHTEHSAALARVPVIDMRGPEKRVLSGYHALRAAAPRYEDVPRRECPHLALPELLHNLNLLVNMCEQDIIECSREGHTAEDRQVALERDRRALEDTMRKGDEEIAVMESIIEEMERLSRPDLSLDEAYQVFNRLQTDYPLEYSCLCLGGSVVSSAALGGLLGAALASWRPLKDPGAPQGLLAMWAPLLSAQALQELFWQPWLEQMSMATGEWEVREPGTMLGLVACWWDVAPERERRALLRSALVPRLASAAAAWDPTADTLPLHHWVLPWHAYAGDLLEESVYPGLRARLGQALQGWHPMDGSALCLLRPWAQAWAPALPSLTALHILPKLESAMRAIPVEPDANPTESWGWCSSWQDLLGPRALAGAAGRGLLPRWLSALAAWLNRRPPHSHLIQHYSMWKNLFSEELQREVEFSETFRKALDMMNRSLDAPVPAPPPPPSQRISTTAIAEVMASNNQQLSFTELLETKCAERGVSLVPLVGRSREGRPLLKLGQSLQCYIIRNVIMYSADQGRSFQPVGIDTLLQLAASQP